MSLNRQYILTYEGSCEDIKHDIKMDLYYVEDIKENPGLECIYLAPNSFMCEICGSLSDKELYDLAATQIQVKYDEDGSWRICKPLPEIIEIKVIKDKIEHIEKVILDLEKAIRIITSKLIDIAILENKLSDKLKGE